MIAHIYVTKKEEVPDAESKRVKGWLRAAPEVLKVKEGKYFRVELLETDYAKAADMVEKLCEALLASQVYETYGFSIDLELACKQKPPR